MDNRIFAVMLILSVLPFVACKSHKKHGATLPKPVVEDHSYGEYKFPQGFYYAYDFGDDRAYQFNLQDALKALIERKYRPEELWYKPGASSCVPPGSEFAMTVIVEPVLLLRFDKPQTNIELMGYKFTSEPSAGSCAYHVMRYRF